MLKGSRFFGSGTSHIGSSKTHGVSNGEKRAIIVFAGDMACVE